MRTRLTRKYGMSLPLIGAGESFAGSPVLTAAVSNAGGMGVLGAQRAVPRQLREWIAQTARLTEQPFAIELDPLCCGERHVEECAKARVTAVIFCWEAPPDAWIRWLQQSGVRVWFRTVDRDRAKQAVQAGCDVIVAQGVDLTSYGGDDTTLETIAEMVQAVAPIPVVGAGNLAHGPDVEAALALGAEAVCMETPAWVVKKLASSCADSGAVVSAGRW